MSKAFAAINDPVHNLIRALTRHTPLGLRITPGELPTMAYRVEPEALPPGYYALAIFHALEGLSLEAARHARGLLKLAEAGAVLEMVNYFDAVNLDRRCCRDVRLKIRKSGPGMLSGELLCFGTGMIRARNDDPEDTFQAQLWSQYGRLRTRYEEVHAQIRALHRTSWPMRSAVQKESFDSTNVIYGDVLGELEQIWDRRADTVFLEQVTQSLQSFRKRAQIAAFVNPPLALEKLIELHLRAQALWRKPPTDSRSLLHRLEYILSHTKIDNSPDTVWDREPSSPWQPRHPEAGTWPGDDSGYDGWLGSP